jgi:hypothetical protein
MANILVYRIVLTVYLLGIARYYRKLVDGTKGLTGYVKDTLNRSSLAGMEAIPEEYLDAIEAECKRMEKSGTVRAFILPESLEDLPLYLPAIQYRALVKFGTVSPEDIKLIQAFNDNAENKLERDVYTSARKAATVMLRLSATVEAIESGELQTWNRRNK